MHSPPERLHALDAVRAFALLLGVAFHAMLSFVPGLPPGLWATIDNSPSPFLAGVSFVSHSFRMTLFFFIAGYFARLMHQRLGTRAFWRQRVQRIGVPLVVGWILIAPAIGFIWRWGAMKLAGGAPPVPLPPFEGFGAFPLIHLWFLYQLLWLYAGALLVRGLIVRLDRGESLRKALDRVTTGALHWPLGALLLGLPLAACLLSLPTWVPQAGIPTPDRSLIPLLPAAVGYGMAFAFGWLVHRAPHALVAIRQSWVSHICLALVASLTCLALLGAHPGVAMPSQIKQMFTLAFVVSTWAWSFALTGLALRFLAGHSALIRYLADASYWIYLAHLPLVTAMQVWVSKWPLHWGLKFPFILLGSLALLLLSYHFLVRSTAVGVVLNGRRAARHAPVAAQIGHRPEAS
jgi:peptidoglycan/LPS O-acetylase OafA/YrhL